MPPSHEPVLSETTQQLQRIALEATANGVLIADRDGTILWVNPGFTRLTGFTSADACGQNPRILKSSEQDDAFYKDLWNTILSGNVWHGELINRRKDGSHYIEEQTITPVKSDSGEVTHFIAIKQDISARHKAEKELQESKEHLLHLQKMESIGRLASGVAHDFNNLLVVILSYSHLLQEKLHDGDVLKRYATEISLAGDRAAALTQRLLTFGRRQSLELETFDINELLDEAVDMLERLLGVDVDLITNLDEQPVLVRADRLQLEQAIVNLAVNARDAMPSGGKLTITTQRTEFDDHHPAVPLDLPPGSYAIIRVRDSGEGMKAEILDRIFDPFFTTKESGKGTGLGLAMVYGIVKRVGGDIDVESEPGVGTTFTIHLPLVGALEKASVTSTPPSLPATGSETILVVEDEDRVRHLVDHVLEGAGYHILSARNAGEAMLLCGEGRLSIDLLLTDVVMPFMNGPTLARRLEDLMPGMKVLYMTGHSEDVIEEHGGARIQASLLHKPFTPESLGNKVREVLGSPV